MARLRADVTVAGQDTIGPDDALASLYAQHHARMVRLAYMLTSHSGVAEEIVQDAFVRLWRSWGRIREPDKAGAYLRRTVVNLSRSTLRRRVLEVRHLVSRRDDAVEVEPATRVDLLAALARLPTGQRTCVVLRFYEDLTEAETARLLGVSVGTVKSQTHKALKRLESLLEDGDDDGS